MRGCALLACLAAIGCSELTETSGQVVALEILAPTVTALDVGDTTRVFARAVNKDGEEVPDAPIQWLAPDTTATVDTVGLVTALARGPARVQVRTGSLVSNFVNLTILDRPDSLVLVSPDTATTVPASDNSSLPLIAQLLTISGSDTQPVANQLIFYQVIEPDFSGDPTARTVEFTGGALVDTATTGVDGLPTLSILLNRVTGTTQPDSAIVEISAFRFQRRDTVPGTGQRFTIRFN